MGISAGDVPERQLARACRKRCHRALQLQHRREVFHRRGSPLTAKPGRWVGAKVGVFALGSGTAAEFGYASFDWFRVE
jgi:hypothetical protein